MNERSKKILYFLICEHIKTGLPVGSKALVENYSLDVSPATIRNEMADLEESGYIIQPHTSAGRIPTKRAYDLYLSEIKSKKPAKKELQNFIKMNDNLDESIIKDSAKALSELSQLMVFWAINKNNLYYTGISQLLRQPEFRELNLIYNISGIIDQVDEIVGKIFESTPDGVNTLTGNENPFGDFFGSIICKYRLNGKVGMFGIIGPLRMDYEKNLGLVDEIYNRIIS